MQDEGYYVRFMAAYLLVLAFAEVISLWAAVYDVSITQ